MVFRLFLAAKCSTKNNSACLSVCLSACLRLKFGQFEDIALITLEAAGSSRHFIHTKFNYISLSIYIYLYIYKYIYPKKLQFAAYGQFVLFNDKITLYYYIVKLDIQINAKDLIVTAVQKPDHIKHPR